MSIKGRVLVLNNSYEPLTTMSIEKAMGKLSRADSTLSVVAWSKNNTIRTVDSEYPVPSILRLNYYVDLKKRRDNSEKKREKIFTRDKQKCGYCGIKAGKYHPVLKKKFTKEYMTLDHIMPQSRGGLTRADNLVLACRPCNKDKKDRTPEEANMPLLVSQTLLKARMDRVMMVAHSDMQPEWKHYLFLKESDNPVNSDEEHTKLRSL